MLRYLVIRYEGELPAKREMNRPVRENAEAPAAAPVAPVAPVCRPRARRGRGRERRDRGRGSPRFEGRNKQGADPVKEVASHEQSYFDRNLTRDPETRTTASGVTMCQFTIAVNRRFVNQQGVREADFIPIVTWRQTAELCSRYLSKGRKVAVEGVIQVRSYDAQDGSKRYVTEEVAAIRISIGNPGGVSRNCTTAIITDILL